MNPKDLPMPPGGARELLKSASGRKYLAKMQERYKDDILQPSDPKFKKVYGAKIEKDQKIKAAQEDDARAKWQENKEKREFERRKKQNPGRFKKFL